MVFKDDIQPKWEDPKNQYGGSIIIELKDIPAEEIDLIWKHVVFGIIGNSLKFSEFINGCRLLDRLKKHHMVKFEVWISKGFGLLKKGDPEREKNIEIKESILDQIHQIVN